MAKLGFNHRRELHRSGHWDFYSVIQPIYMYLQTDKWKFNIQLQNTHTHRACVSVCVFVFLLVATNQQKGFSAVAERADLNWLQLSKTLETQIKIADGKRKVWNLKSRNKDRVRQTLRSEQTENIFAEEKLPRAKRNTLSCLTPVVIAKSCTAVWQTMWSYHGEAVAVRDITGPHKSTGKKRDSLIPPGPIPPAFTGSPPHFCRNKVFWRLMNSY